MLRIRRQSTPNPDEKYLTLEEAARVLRMSSKTLRGLAVDGKIPAHRLTRKWLFKREDIESLAP